MLSATLRVLVRRLLSHPGFTAIALLTLALGIGANAAIFTLVHGILIQPLPYPESERLVLLWHGAPGIDIPQFNQSYGSYALYRDQAESFEAVALFDQPTLNLTGDGPPERPAASRVSSSMFQVLRIEPLLGRAFHADDDRPGTESRVAILSYGFWQRRFGGDEGVLGETLRLDGEPWEIVGILPEGLSFPDEETELWIPHAIDPEELGNINFSYDALARLRPGVTVEEATADLERLVPRLPEYHAEEMSPRMLEDTQMRAFVTTLREELVGEVEDVLWILLAAVGFVLLIASANVANLFLVRAEGRQRELAVRSALGASRRALVGGFLIESLALAVLGGLLGTGLAWAAVVGLRTLDPGNLPRLAEVSLTPPVLLFTLGVSLLVGLAVGLLPAARMASDKLLAGLKEGGRGGSAGRGTRLARNSLVVTQVALALVLLVASGLLLRSFQELREVDPGFSTQGVLTLRLSLPEAEYPTAQDALRFHARLLESLEALPGVERAGTVRNLPLTDGQTNPALMVEDFPLEPGELPPVVRANYVAPIYFEAIGIPVVEGRGFDPLDLQRPSDAVLLSRSLARRFWPAESALGKRVRRGLDDEDATPWYTVVGVVGDVRDDGLQAKPVDQVYFPLLGIEEEPARWVMATTSVAIRTAGDPRTLAESVRRTIWGLDPNLPVVNMQTTAALAADAMARTTFAMILLAVAALVSLVLGAVGIYGVISYLVSQRTREIGVRMALGASRRRVRRMVVTEGFRLAAVGVVLGLAGSALTGGVLSVVLFQVSAFDPLTYGGVVMVLVAMTFLACFLPAHRAASVPPMEALRQE